MKTAVSIPNDVYMKAEQLAEQTNRSRSPLYGDALLQLVLAGIDVVLGR